MLKAAEIGTVGTVYYSFFLSLNLFYFNKAAISDPVFVIFGPGLKWLKKAEKVWGRNGRVRNVGIQSETTS